MNLEAQESEMPIPPNPPGMEPTNPLDEDENPQSWEQKPPGIQPGTSDQVTPLKHVNMYKKHFTKENLEKAVEYLKTKGRSVPPLFMTIDTRGEWETIGGKLYWTAHNGSTGKLQVIATEDLQAFIKEQWYKQDMPSGIYSLHKALTLTHLGVSRPAISNSLRSKRHGRC